MAKSFTIHPLEATSALKSASERDLFDLLVEPPAATPAESPRTTTPPSTASTPSNKDEAKPEKSAVEAAPPSKSPVKRVRRPNHPAPAAESASPVPAANEPALTVAQLVSLAAELLRSTGTDTEARRQTFVIGQQYLEQLRDFVHAQRAAGNYLYSQRQALEDALTLLFATQTSIAQRPPHIKELEQRRRTQIQRGRRAKPGAEILPTTSA